MGVPTSPTPDAIRRFREEYETYVRSVLLPTNRELRDFFREVKLPSYWRMLRKDEHLPVPSPIARSTTRIKRPESVLDKILRRRDDFPEGLSIQSVHRMADAVAGRIVVHFLSGLPLVDQKLQNCDRLEVSDEKPATAYLRSDLANRLGLAHLKILEKDSGYASIHYLVRLRSSAVPDEQRPWLELQVRTLTEDAWAEIEHILGYKPLKRTSFAVRKQFQIISRHLEALDEHFNLLAEELSRFQKEGEFQESDSLNAENLPPVLYERGIACAQREIDGLLKLLASRGIETVLDLRTSFTDPLLELVRNSYVSAEGRRPNDFEVVAAIAAIAGMPDGTDPSDAVRAHIEFLSAWSKLKEEI